MQIQPFKTYTGYIFTSDTAVSGESFLWKKTVFNDYTSHYVKLTLTIYTVYVVIHDIAKCVVRQTLTVDTVYVVVAQGSK